MSYISFVFLIINQHNWVIILIKLINANTLNMPTIKILGFFCQWNYRVIIELSVIDRIPKMHAMFMMKTLTEGRKCQVHLLVLILLSAMD